MKKSYEFEVDEIMVIDFDRDGWKGYYGERDKSERQHTEGME